MFRDSLHDPILCFQSEFSVEPLSQNVALGSAICHFINFKTTRTCALFSDQLIRYIIPVRDNCRSPYILYFSKVVRLLIQEFQWLIPCDSLSPYFTVTLQKNEQRG